VGPHAEPLPHTPIAAHPFSVRSRRDRLIAAMANVVSEEGYQRTSVSKVVAAAGVSRNAFYEHFANKEDCFLAAYDATVQQVMARVREASRPSDDWDRRLEAGFAAFLRFAAAEPALAWLCVVEVLAAGPRALARRDEAMRAFGRFLERSRRQHGSSAVPPTLTEVVAGGVYEIIYARILSRRTASLPELLPDIMYVWLAPFVGPEQAAAARVACVRRHEPTATPRLVVAASEGRQDTDVF
jgi:AcrR family transcriptional regulator